MAKGKSIAIEFHQGDLPAGLAFGEAIAVDTETTGLSPQRDRLCLVQVGLSDGSCHLVQFAQGDYRAPNLRAVLGDGRVTKIFHYARFDVMMIRKHLGLICAPIYCTKIASKLVRTYTSGHGLKDLCKELLDVELSKEHQSSDWAAPQLSEAQRRYAASDVLYLHELREKLDAMLAREGRSDIARACFGFVATRAALDLSGWNDEDIFSH